MRAGTVLLVTVWGASCAPAECPDGFTMNDDGLCLQDDRPVRDGADADTDTDADTDADADTDSDTDTDSGVGTDPSDLTVCGAGGGDYTSIQDALDAAPDDAVIVVCAGTYTESLAIERPVEIRGEQEASDVVVDAGGHGTTVYVDTAGNVTLRALTLTGAEYGAIESSRADLTIADAVIAGNDSDEGTITQSNGSLLVTDSRVSDNTSDNVAGIVSDSADVRLEHVELTGNSAPEDTAYLMRIGDGGDLVMRNVLAVDNDIRILFDVSAEHADITNVTAEATTYSGATVAIVQGISDLAIRNSIFFADDYGASALEDYSSKTPVVTYNDYRYVERISLDGSNRFPVTNDFVDPQFVDPEAGDYHLGPRSECIDAGDPDDTYDDTDGTRNDMGAYGGPGGDW